MLHVRSESRLRLTRACRRRRSASQSAALDARRWATQRRANCISNELSRIIGAIILLPPESFFVPSKEGPLADGELKHAAPCARPLHDDYEGQEKLLAVVAWRA
jgi:hypothetical protein